MQINTPTQQAHVIYTREILENGHVVKRFAPKRNLLLDSGLDIVGKQGWAAAFQVCVLGTGTTPTKRDSGSITFTRAGQRVTASAAFFVAADVNRILKFDSGEEMYVRAFVSNTQVDVDNSGDLPASEGTVWFVEQTTLDTQTKAISVGGGLDHGTIYDAATGTVRHRRTFLGPVETGNVVYKEIGWSNTSASPATLLGRDLIPGGGDALVANQQYRVRVDLYVTFAPLTPVPTPELFPQWPGSSGMAQIDGISCDTVNASGQVANPTSPFYAGDSNYTYANKFFLSKAAAEFGPPVFSTAKALSGSCYIASGVRRSYQTGTRKNYIDVIFHGAAAGGSELADIRSLGMEFGGSSFTGSTSGCNSSFRVIMTNPQYKDPWWKLTITFSLSWGRVLIN